MQKWQTVEQFDETYEGWCWIVFNGHVVEAYHRNGKFHVSITGEGCYIGPITYVQKWIKPEAP